MENITPGSRLREIIREICNEKGIRFELLSRDWIIKLIKDNEYRYIIGGRFSLNSYASGNIASDKYATYEVLKSEGIPIIEHKILFNPKIRKGYVSDLENLRKIIKYYKQQKNKKLIIKSNHGSCGKQVYLCKNIFEIPMTIRKLFKESDSISICPFYDIDVEYRTIYLDGECLLVFGKYNSKSSWKHNLSQGALPKILEEGELKSRLCEIAKKVGNTMNIRFASIDIIRTKQNELLALEVNSIVTLDKFIDNTENGYSIAKEIYEKAVEKMFE
jgi:glutathione synthase/RimK-type ligase-like ATP-grasp enzyme